jgi:ferrous iron transport protein A
LSSSAVRLSDLAKGIDAVVEGVEARDGNDAIARRLRDLGFVRGEPVRIVASGPFGAEPLLAVIGHSRFALRRAEAARVTVRIGAATSPSVPAPAPAAPELVS